tara:strand:- start:211 stop:387 length:177 start_codon:yes stop_codon:yes gene_type:complete
MTFNDLQALPQFLILERAELYRESRQLNLSPSFTSEHMNMGGQMVIGVEKELETIEQQ